MHPMRRTGTLKDPDYSCKSVAELKKWWELQRDTGVKTIYQTAVFEGPLFRLMIRWVTTTDFAKQRLFWLVDRWSDFNLIGKSIKVSAFLECKELFQSVMLVAKQDAETWDVELNRFFSLLQLIGYISAHKFVIESSQAELLNPSYSAKTIIQRLTLYNPCLYYAMSNSKEANSYFITRYWVLPAISKSYVFFQ